MKIFTLQWWMNMYAQSIARALGAFSVKDQTNGLSIKTYKRYYNLHVWIEERIINKYGEQDA